MHQMQPMREGHQVRPPSSKSNGMKLRPKPLKPAVDHSVFAAQFDSEVKTARDPAVDHPSLHHLLPCSAALCTEVMV